MKADLTKQGLAVVLAVGFAATMVGRGAVIARLQSFGGTGIDNYSEGTWGTLVVSHTDDGVLEVGGMNPHTLTYHGSAGLDLTTGVSSVVMVGTISNLPLGGDPGPVGYIDQYMTDMITVGAGDSGLHNGDVTQIRFKAHLGGTINIEGGEYQLNSGNWLGFTGSLVRDDTNETIVQLHYDSGVMVAPVSRVVDLDVDQVVNVIVGKTYRLKTDWSVDYNDDWHGPGEGLRTGSIDFGNTAVVQVGYVEGAENILIHSEAGAAILPVPEPATLVLVVAGLGMVSGRRRTGSCERLAQ